MALQYSKLVPVNEKNGMVEYCSNDTRFPKSIFIPDIEVQEFEAIAKNGGLSLELWNKYLKQKDK